MKAKHFVKDHPDHHHVHAGVWLVSVGHLTGVLQRIHERLELDIAAFKGVCQPPLSTLDEELAPDINLPLLQILNNLRSHLCER